MYYISPTQVNILTPPGSMPNTVAVQVTNNGATSPPFTVQAQPLSPSFFAVNGGPYVIAQHSADYSLIGPASFSVPGYPFTPAKPGETVVLYANGFGATNPAVVSGSATQSGTLSPLPGVTIGGITAQVTFAGLIAPGEFQFNVVIPANAASGDNAITATYGAAALRRGSSRYKGPRPRPIRSRFTSPPGATISGAALCPLPIPPTLTARLQRSITLEQSSRRSTKLD